MESRESALPEGDTEGAEGRAGHENALPSGSSVGGERREAAEGESARAAFARLQKRAIQALQEAAAADKGRRGAAKQDKAQLTREVVAQYRQALELLRGAVGSPECGGAVKL